MQDRAEIADFERQEVIFQAALQLADSSARATYLDLACGDDTALREQIDALLSFEGHSVALTQPAAISASALLPAVARESLSEHTGPRLDRIGHYRVIEKIGEGGCGDVYEAEQTEPIRRRVALKVIKAGMDTCSVIARFEAERQALALMDHPNIAKVFDAGSTENGRPYFVMELVNGVKITDYCAEHSLSINDRLALFLQVCDAVQHAHQKGLIHRDLKPSNILVTHRDRPPRAQVIDFGIAKAIQGKLTTETIQTLQHQFLGTPAYMSPEQADLSPDIDTRTDIYSLGVLLHELLTGRPPFDNHELLTAGLDEMRRIIREVEPQRPSRFVGADSRRPTSSALRVPDSAISFDLDCIVLKCLEKDRSRRYDTVGALAKDIERYLGDEPILARPVSRAYKLRKFVLRNKLEVTSACLIVLTLIFAAIVSSTQAIRARRAEREQASQRQRAERRLADTFRFLNEAFEKVSPALSDLIGAAGPRKDLARAAAAIVEESRQDAEMTPEFRRVLSQFYTELGFVHAWFTGNITGDFPAGLKAGEEAIKLLTPRDGENMDDDRARRLAQAEMMSGFAAWGMWDTNRAMAHFQQMHQWGSFLTNSTDVGVRLWGARVVRWARGCIGDTLTRAGAFKRSLEEYWIPLLRETSEPKLTLERARTAPPGDVWDCRSILESVGLLKYKLGSASDALPYLQESLGYSSILNERQPDHAQFASTLAETRAETGEVLLALHRSDEGHAQLEEAMALTDQLIRRDPNNPGFTGLKINVLRYHASGLVASAEAASMSDSERGAILRDAEKNLKAAEKLVDSLKQLPYKAALRHEIVPVWERLRQAREGLNVSSTPAAAR
jgi:serine/threonine protein kinase